MEQEKIKTYGQELVMVGVVVFVAIIAFTIVTYMLFIKGRVKESVEYKTAVYFVENSETLKEHLLSPIDSFEFDDLRVVEKTNYGICEVTFDLILENGLEERLRLGLVKVADFWVLYEALLSPDAPSEYALISTYQKILMLYEKLDYQEYEIAQFILQLIKIEMRDAHLSEFLTARVSALEGNKVLAQELLGGLLSKVKYSKPAVMYELAMVEFASQNYEKAIELLLQIQKDIQLYQIGEDKLLKLRSLFTGLPKDPFILSFSHDDILADIYINLALAYYQVEKYEKGLEYSDRAIEQATQINSKVIMSSSFFVRALNLVSLERYEAAEKGFALVISDLDNTNLSQKAWAYFYRAEIASRFGHYNDSLDYYETAVGLDPFNYPIRKGAIMYLLDRNFKGDLEIALGFALRGMDYDVERSLFKDFASLIYSRLGMQDETSRME